MKKCLLNRTKIDSAFLISFMLGVPSVVSATDFFSSDNPVYVGVGYGKTKDKYMDFKDKSIKTDHNDKGFIGFVGKKYNSDIDIEGFYAKLGKFKATQGTQSGTSELTAFGVKGNYIFSQSDSFLPYITVGGANMDTKQSNLRLDGDDGGFKLIFGGGVQHKYSKDIKLRVEYLDLRYATYIWGGISTSF
jgi:hypothetical protein